jgi:aminoglycoside phosphotransferase family enzyme/predicted kinase
MDEKTLEALLEPATYGPGVENVRLIQTHSSWVFLTGEFVYKVKKPVNFGFLDYTTLESRYHFCNEEVKLNRRLAPEIYLGVVPIKNDQGRIALGGRGEVVDYAVKMKEIPQSAIMTELLKRGEIRFDTVARLAGIVADFHRRAETNPEIEKFGSPKTIKFNWDENFEQTEGFRDISLSSEIFNFIQTHVTTFMGEKKPIFQKRIADKKIRRCHGDLHSGNIFITDKIHIFDCIEFNLRFSCSDTTSDVAFLGMDLDFHNRKDLADHFIERYIQASGDSELLTLLDFYKCYRAYVRGKVTSFKLNDPGIGKEEKDEAVRFAKSYFALAQHYAHSLFEKPKLVIVSGLPGVGKTYIAERLAERNNWYHLKTDFIRKKLAGLDIEQHYYDHPTLYSPEMSLKTYQEMMRRAEVYLKAGKSVILDATFNKKKPREETFALAQKLNVKVCYIHFTCPEEIVLQRLEKRSREISASDATKEVYFKMKGNFETFGNKYGPLLIIDTTDDLGKILEKVEELTFS